MKIERDRYHARTSNRGTLIIDLSGTSEAHPSEEPVDHKKYQQSLNKLKRILGLTGVQKDLDHNLFSYVTLNVVT